VSAFDPAIAVPPATINQSPPQLRPAQVPQRRRMKRVGSRHVIAARAYPFVAT
jgi:hypothetical protein